MKKTFTLLAAMLLSVVMYAFPNPSKLSISSTDNSDIRVIVDGNKYRSNNNEVIVNNLTGGYHAIRVYQLKNGGSGSYYGYQKNNYRLVYNNSVYIKPQYYVDITINRFGKAYVDEQLITGGFEDEGDDWDDNNNPAGNNVIHAMNPVSFDQFKQSLKRESFSAMFTFCMKDILFCLPRNFLTQI